MNDVTQDMLKKLTDTFDQNYDGRESLNLKYLMGSLEYYIKKVFIQDSETVTVAAMKMGLNRTTLVESFRKFEELPSDYLVSKV